MKPLVSFLLSATLLAGSAIPAHSGSLLGLIGDKDSGALVTVGSGDAGSSGAVNIGVGGGGGNVLDANVGGGSLANANVGSSSSSGLNADIGLLNNTARVGVGVGGDSLVDLDVDIGGGGNGTPGTPGTPGNNGGTRIIAIPGGSSTSTTSAAARCVGISNSDLERLLQSTRIDGSWQRANGVNLQRVALCPEQRSFLARSLPNSSIGQQLRAAIASDALLSASLSRSSFDASRVLAVQRDGTQLTVFVY